MNFSKSYKGFTLIELLLVIGILAILAAVVLTVLNPAESLRQARDAKRISDLDQLDQALQLAESDDVSMGTANVVYVSVPDNSGGVTTTCSTLGLPAIPGWTYQCSNSDNYRKNNGTGWVPVDFTALVTVPSALTVLPVDPVNSTSTCLYYTYVNGWELTTLVESTKYQTKYSGVGTSTVYSIGNYINISPNGIATRTCLGNYTLTISKTGAGSGTVTSNPSGINCGATCGYAFASPIEVILTAQASQGSTFTGWSGAGCSGTGTCVVTMSQARAVTANFDVVPVFCSVGGDKNTYDTINGDIVYCDNGNLLWTTTVTQTPASGDCHNFDGDSTGCNFHYPCSIDEFGICSGTYTLEAKPFTWINISATQCDAWDDTDEGTCEANSGCFWDNPDCFYSPSVGSCTGQGSDFPACNACDSLTYAGYSDWVLPNCTSETYGTGCQLYVFGMDVCGWSATCGSGDPEGCSACDPSWDTYSQSPWWYWASTESATLYIYGDNLSVRIVYGGGGVGTAQKNSGSTYVRCVRGQ